MKKYYIIGSITSVLIFIVMFFLVGISSCNASNKNKKKVEEIGKSSVVLRYYKSDDFDNGEIIYMRVMDKENYQISIIPNKEGYQFVGLYDAIDYNVAKIYVDSNGRGILPLSGDILLYPVFVALEV